MGMVLSKTSSVEWADGGGPPRGHGGPPPSALPTSMGVLSKNIGIEFRGVRLGTFLGEGQRRLDLGLDLLLDSRATLGRDHRFQARHLIDFDPRRRLILGAVAEPEVVVGADV